MTAPPGPRGDGLRACGRPLSVQYDVALLDLDGVLYLGKEAIPHVAPALRAARSDGMRLAFVTNNAMRTPAEVAEHLAALGVPAGPDEVVTSSQAAAAMLSERLPAGAAVMVAGGRGLRQAVRAAGFSDVASADDDPAAVVQGLDPDITYQRLAEAALAVRRGALWVAANRDLTLPTPRGLLPGNGALVALVAAATGRTPEVAGKPEWALHAESIRRSHATRPLVVGDRLDTDIEAAVRWQTPSMLVLTGVTSPLDLLSAAPHRRPDYLADDLRGLIRTHPEVAPSGPGGAAAAGRHVCNTAGCISPRGGRATPAGPHDRGAGDADGPDGLNALRAACMAVWHAPEGSAAGRHRQSRRRRAAFPPGLCPVPSRPDRRAQTTKPSEQGAQLPQVPNACFDAKPARGPGRRQPEVTGGQRDQVVAPDSEPNVGAVAAAAVDVFDHAVPKLSRESDPDVGDAAGNSAVRRVPAPDLLVHFGKAGGKVVERRLAFFRRSHNPQPVRVPGHDVPHLGRHYPQPRGSHPKRAAPCTRVRSGVVMQQCRQDDRAGATSGVIAPGWSQP